MHDGVRQVELVLFLLLFFIVVFGALARKLQVGYPIVLVVAGLLVSFIPGLPTVTLNPDVVFLAILPPLLFHAAWQTSWRDFRYNLASILMLAFGLVIFTVLAVAYAGETLFSLLDWRSGFVLGAIIAPTDAIAMSSIARRLGLPDRVIDVLEGESLVNDATGLLALEFGIALLVSGHTPSAADGALRLLWLVAAGLTIGIAVAWVVRRIEMYLDDGPIEITLCLITPYAAYFVAEEAHASGVLAVVACGLYLGRHSSEFFSPAVRLQSYAMSDALDFVLNGLVFVLIGLQLPLVLAGLHAYSMGLLLLYGVSFSALVIALRLIWVYPGAYMAYVIRRRILKQPDPLPSYKALFVVGWTGMRGVVSLAAALSIPESMADGQPFASRNLIIFLTFSVILATLVVQGLSLPPLIRLLGLDGRRTVDSEEEDARRSMILAAMTHLQEAEASLISEAAPHLKRTYEFLREHHEVRLTALPGQQNRAIETIDRYSHHRKISHDLIRVERRTALALRQSGKISDLVLRRLEHELDLSETRLSEN